MDEPFSALDPLIRDHLQDELLSLQQKLRKTIIFVSHDLDEALKLGSHVSIMDAGKIVQQGTSEDIVENPANDYVAKFVANMNPFKVLRCSSLMRTMGQLNSVEGDIATRYLDEEGMYTCTVDQEGRLKAASYGGSEVTFVPYREDLDLRKLPANKGVTARTDTPLKAAVEVNHALGLPMPILNGDQKVVGVVGPREILGSLLKRDKESKGGPE
jgi:glycine betaine/proline transport system ATP-binding protein